MASPGPVFSEAAVARAADLAGGGTVAVLIVARLHGYAFGMPNPGLLPTRKEKQAVQANLEKAIGELGVRGVETSGEIAITRNPTKVFTRAAVSQGVAAVVMDPQPGSPLRRFVEGDLAASLRRRLRARSIAVIVV
jgi:hypothetical protein